MLIARSKKIRHAKSEPESLVRSFQAQTNSLSRSCVYPIEKYKGPPLPGILSINEPLFEVPETTENVYTDSLNFIEDTEEKSTSPFEDGDSLTRVLYREQSISPVSNFMALVEFLNDCEFGSKNLLKIVSLGRCQYIYDLVAEFFPRITKIEVCGKNRVPTSPQNKRVTSVKGIFDERDSGVTWDKVFMFSLTDSTVVDQEDILYQSECYCNIKPDRASLIFSKQNINGRVYVQPFSSQARILPGDSDCSLSEEKTVELINHYNVITRYVWPWKFSRGEIEVSKLRFDECRGFSILYNYYKDKKDVKLSESFLSERWKEINASIDSKVYRLRKVSRL
jgi:hypothetical protein